MQVFLTGEMRKLFSLRIFLQFINKILFISPKLFIFSILDVFSIALGEFTYSPTYMVELPIRKGLCEH